MRHPLGRRIFILFCISDAFAAYLPFATLLGMSHSGRLPPNSESSPVCFLALLQGNSVLETDLPTAQKMTDMYLPCFSYISITCVMYS